MRNSMLHDAPVRARALAAAIFALAVGTGCAAARPQETMSPSQAVQEPDPPGRVGRLAIIQGSVSFLAAEDTDWSAAEPNHPISSGDRLWADESARAEVDIGDAVVRVWQRTELDVVRLGDYAFQVRIPEGSISERVWRVSDAQSYEIDAPNAAIAFDTAGTYRVDVSADGATTVLTVRSGSADVTAAGSFFTVAAGQRATIRGDSVPTYELADAGAPDDLDTWASDRDARVERATTTRQYVSAAIAGYADLDEYGRWTTDAVCGPIWYPRVVMGWVPYRTGHWWWSVRFGWTWIDEAAWGWAPFHYGRWMYVGGAWGWCPGAIDVVPVYAPALVIFIGGSTWGPEYFGPGGGIGWFPLGPGEIYWPPYIASVPYIEWINRPHAPKWHPKPGAPPRGIKYRNRDVPGGVTTVPWRRFPIAAPVGPATVHVPDPVITKAPVLGYKAPVVPTMQSIAPPGPLPGAARREPARPPVQLMTRPTAALRSPPPTPVPFSAQQRTLAGTAGRPLAPTEVRRIRAPTIVRPTPIPSRPAAAPQRRTITPAPTARPPQPAPRPANPPAPKPTPTRRPTGLDGQYHAEVQALDVRQRTEYATPPKGSTTQQIAARQETERNDLRVRYQRAAASGKSTLPAPRTKPK